MELHLVIKMNEKLFLRDPQETELGKSILHHSVVLIHNMGLESFTFKKLADAAGTTEATIYRYFENKHKLLIYLTAWYWSWLLYQISYVTNNIEDPGQQLKRIIHLLATPVEDDDNISYINESQLHQIVVDEGMKAYLTKQVSADNKQQFFKPYKDVCAHIGNIILKCDPDYKYPHSLSSSIIEIAHLQKFFNKNLPSLTDFGKNDEPSIHAFLEELFFCNLKIAR